MIYQSLRLFYPFRLRIDDIEISLNNQYSLLLSSTPLGHPGPIERDCIRNLNPYIKVARSV